MRSLASRAVAALYCCTKAGTGPLGLPRSGWMTLSSPTVISLKVATLTLTAMLAAGCGSAATSTPTPRTSLAHSVPTQSVVPTATSSNGWGNNPATFGAAATMVAAVAIIFAWLSLRESKAQRRALETEIAARMRPWVGLFDFGFEAAKGGEAKLRLLLRNFGPLPAQQARLKLVVEPREVYSDERPNPIVRDEPQDKALMPMENGDYSIDLARYPQMNEWIGAARDVVVNGTFEYAAAENKFQSQFQVTLWFSRNQSSDVSVPTNWRNRFSRNRPSNVPVPTNWRNVSAT